MERRLFIILKNISQPDALYLLDEPEVSLSPANQVLLAEEINKTGTIIAMPVYHRHTFPFYARNSTCKNI